MIRDCSGPALSDDLQITREIDGRHTRRRGSRDYGGRRRGEEAALFAPSKVVEVGLGCTVSCETQRCEDQEEIECCKPNVLRIALARVERDGGGEKPVAVVLRGKLHSTLHEAFAKCQCGAALGCLVITPSHALRG
jgi:hypothetical protein